jgi:hypothetical protein
MNETAKPAQNDPADAMTEFCRKAAVVLHRLTVPVEILSHLLYLASHSDDPDKVRQYLADAQEQARIVARAHLDLLSAYPGPKIETT